MFELQLRQASMRLIMSSMSAKAPLENECAERRWRAPALKLATRLTTGTTLMLSAVTAKLREAIEPRFLHPYFLANGWYTSTKRQDSVDNLGPVPWITYPARAMLERVARTQHKVFEYGCGNSSLWWAARTYEVVAVEHNPDWADTIEMQAPANLRIIRCGSGEEAPADALVSQFFSLTSDPVTNLSREAAIYHGLVSQPFAAYALTLTQFAPGHFDIVVVDGMARALSAWIALHCVNPD